MSLPSSIRGYVLTPDDGEALWFNKGLLIVKATAEQTEGKYSAVEMRGRKGFSAPLHVHHSEDEFFIVLAGDVRFQLGDEAFEAKTGSLMYGPREVPHSFHVDSTEARLLLLFGPVPDRNGATVTAVLPIARNAMPPTIVSIAIIVTPKGLCFCSCSMMTMY